MTKMIQPDWKGSERSDLEHELAGLDWLRDQVINDNKLELCATEQERVSLLAMLNRQKQRRKKVLSDDDTRRTS